MSDEHHDHHPSPWGPHDWSHGAPHNSFAPIVMSVGIGLFLFVLAGMFDYDLEISKHVYTGEGLVWLFIAMVITMVGMFVFWRQDLSFDGTYEPLATGSPFKNIQIRKVGMFMFLMSEMMVFTSLFSTYMRYRLGLRRCDDVFADGLFDPVTNPTGWQEAVPVTCFEPASHLIASSWWHLAPGAVNTFALIISSFTIVQALRYAKKTDIDEEFRRKRVTMFLATTWILAIMFLTLKMVEWFVGFYIPDLGFIHEHDIKSLVEEGYTIGADNYQHHSYVDEATGAHMTANIRVSASTFYVTTGTHGAHVAGGILGLTYMTFKAWRGGYSPSNAVSIEYFGLYWHFVDLVWVIVFPFFYLY